MFLTQIYGTVLGGFINYAVMISIVTGNRDLLANGNGDSSWSGATIQSYNTNATSWALAKYLYETGARYSIVPIGLAIGAAFVVVHRAIVYVSVSFIIHLLVYYLASYVSLADPSFLVCPQDQRFQTRRDQLTPIHPIRRLHSLQRISDLRHLQPAYFRILRPVLPP